MNEQELELFAIHGVTHHQPDEGSDGEHAWTARKPDNVPGKPFLDRMLEAETEYYLKTGMPWRQRDFN